MKIVFDARWIREKSSGIGVYAREMMRRLPALATDCEFVFLFQSHEAAAAEMREDIRALHNNTSSAVFPCGPMSLASQFKLPRLLDDMGTDVFLSPNYMIPYWWGGDGGKIIATIHDAIPLAVRGYAPKSLTSRFKLLYKHCLRKTVRRATSVITVSESAKRDLTRILGLSERLAAKIHVVYDGADCGSAHSAPVSFDSDDARARKLLYVGRMDPYKNVPGLVRAFADAKKRVPFALRLVIAGSADPRYPEAREEAERLGVTDDVVFTGHISDAELAALYRESDLLTHFSTYEGFGLPIVEAMRAGLPVVCTDGGSQPEVAGGAAEIVKAGDELSLAGAIADILSSPVRMLEMRKAGLVRADEFTWAECAEKTMELIKS